MGYFEVRYDTRVVNYDRRGFIRLTTDVEIKWVTEFFQKLQNFAKSGHTGSYQHKLEGRNQALLHFAQY